MKDVIDFLKLPANILSALAIASGILLFAPDNVVQTLYMTEFRAQYGFSIGLVFVVSISLLAVFSVMKIYKAIANKHNTKKLNESQEKFLLEITGNKAGLIMEFLRQPTHTLTLPMNDGLVRELQYYNVITPAGTTHLVSMPDPRIPFFLQPWVVEKIKGNETLRDKFDYYVDM